MKHCKDLFCLAKDGFIPHYQSEGAAGADLLADIDSEIAIEPGAIMAIPTGISLMIPEGYEGQVRARSGLASRGISVANGVGTIDADYRGIVKVLLVNLGKTSFVVLPKMRIAQLVVLPVIRATFVSVTSEEFMSHSTQRGEGGFGHTGL